MFKRMWTERAQCPQPPSLSSSSPVRSGAGLVAFHTPPSPRSVPGTLSLHPPSLWSLSQAFPPSPCELSTTSEVGTLSSEDSGRSGWLGSRTPQASPSCSPFFVAIWGPGLGRHLLTLSRPIPVGRAGLEGRREVTHVHMVGAQADCVGCDRSGRLTVALGPLRVALGVSRARPERENLCPVFLRHMPPPVCLCLSLDGSSEHRLGLAPFLRRPQSRGWGLACEWGTDGVLTSCDIHHIKGKCPLCAALGCPCLAPPHSLPPAPPNPLPPQGSRHAAGINKTPYCVASDPTSGLGDPGLGKVHGARLAPACGQLLPSRP